MKGYSLYKDSAWEGMEQTIADLEHKLAIAEKKFQIAIDMSMLHNSLMFVRARIAIRQNKEDECTKQAEKELEAESEG